MELVEIFLILRLHSVALLTCCLMSALQCSVPCGYGFRMRAVKCVSVKYKHSVASNLCPRPAPATQQQCRDQRCARWRTTVWSKCSTSCGIGLQQRSVACFRDRRHRVSDFHCVDKRKPQSTKTCEVAACNVYKWTVGDWTKCSSSYCGQGRQYRAIDCVNSANQQAPPSLCAHASKPSAGQNCTDKDCPYEWTLGQWSQCSQTCGVGVQQRSLQCRVKKSRWPRDNGFRLLSINAAIKTDVHEENAEPTNITMYEDQSNLIYYVLDTHCASLSKIDDLTRNCTMGDCDSKYFWRVGPWTPCSNTCGEGSKRRRVYCIDTAGNRADKELCDKNNRPFRTEKCGIRPCAPGDCVELKQQIGENTDDGYHMLTANGFTVQAYCHLMNTSKPRTYIDINGEKNYAEVYGKRLLYPFTCPHNGQRNDSCLCTDESSKAGKTHFMKIRVDLHLMTINYHDLTFAYQEYGRMQMFATAGDCYSRMDCPQGKFNIDLRTTGIRISNEVKWITHGHRSSMRLERSADSTQITGYCGGYCGYCLPDRRTGLKFVFDTAN